MNEARRTAMRANENDEVSKRANNRLKEEKLKTAIIKKNTQSSKWKEKEKKKHSKR